MTDWRKSPFAKDLTSRSASRSKFGFAEILPSRAIAVKSVAYLASAGYADENSFAPLTFLLRYVCAANVLVNMNENKIRRAIVFDILESCCLSDIFIELLSKVLVNQISRRIQQMNLRQSVINRCAKSLNL